MPQINFEAETLLDVIDWKESYEPPLTTNMNIEAIQQFSDHPMNVPDWPSHGQSSERAVKMVTEAAMSYFSPERRDMSIRAKEHSRRMIKQCESKQDFLEMLK